MHDAMNQSCGVCGAIDHRMQVCAMYEPHAHYTDHSQYTFAIYNVYIAEKRKALNLRSSLNFQSQNWVSYAAYSKHIS